MRSARPADRGGGRPRGLRVRSAQGLAALDTADGSVAADPFAPTAELVELLRVHARASRATHGSLRGRVASFMRPVFVRA